MNTVAEVRKGRPSLLIGVPICSAGRLSRWHLQDGFFMGCDWVESGGVICIAECESSEFHEVCRDAWVRIVSAGIFFLLCRGHMGDLPDGAWSQWRRYDSDAGFSMLAAVKATA